MTDRKDFIFKPGLKDDGRPLIDLRTIPLRAILRLKELPPLPDEHNAHDAVGGIEDNRMFGNDKHGDCVKAAMAHQTLTFEKFEQGIQIEIADQEVIDEYYRETGGPDSGLYLTYAMKDWRNHGLNFGGKTYTIYSFAGVDCKDHDQVKYSIYLLNGLIFGMMVFETDIEQFKNGEPWHLTNNNGKFLGGHGVYGHCYIDKDDSERYIVNQEHSVFLCSTVHGLWCMTWGAEQFMTWDFWDARVNQAYAIVDNRNKWQGDDSPVDVERNDAYLREITGTSNNSGCLMPVIGSIIQKVRA